METKIVRVTPAMAENWLEANTINRPLRKSVVDGFIAAYKRGEHRLTHQGIAFADTGELIDGQHRLTAISRMPPEFSLELMVTRGMAKSAFDAIDQGLKRSHSDVLRVPQGQAAVARYLASIYETSRIGLTTQYLVPFVTGIEDQYMQLVGFCPKATKTWSSAAIRSAAILQMLAGFDRDYICMSYYALNHMEFQAMCPVVETLFRQQSTGKTSARQLDLFYRAFKTFDKRNAQMTKIQITDTSTILVKARDIIQSRILGVHRPIIEAARHQSKPGTLRRVQA